MPATNHAKPTKHSKAAIKEHKEHGWTSWTQAERIASDHATKSKRRKPSRRNSNNPMNLIGFGVKGIVGVTALGVTANALSELGKK